MELHDHHCCCSYVILPYRRWCCQPQADSHAKEPPWATVALHTAKILFSFKKERVKKCLLKINIKKPLKIVHSTERLEMERIKLSLPALCPLSCHVSVLKRTVFLFFFFSTAFTLVKHRGFLGFCNIEGCHLLQDHEELRSCHKRNQNRETAALFWKQL